MDHYSPLPFMLVLSSIGGAVAASLCLLFGTGLFLAFCAYSIGGAVILVASALLLARPNDKLLSE